MAALKRLSKVKSLSKKRKEKTDGYQSDLNVLDRKNLPDVVRETLGTLLSPEEEIFVNEYSSTLNLEESYKKAYYPHQLISIQILQRAAISLMKLNHIKEAIRKQLTARMEKININGDRILAEMNYIAFSCLKYIINDDNTVKPMKDIPEFAARAIQTYEIDTRGNVKIRLYDKHKALQELGLYLGMFDPDRNKNMEETARKVREAVAEMTRLTVGEE